MTKKKKNTPSVAEKIASLATSLEAEEPADQMEETASAGTTSTEPPAASSEEDALEGEEPVNQMEETASAGTTSTEPPAASLEADALKAEEPADQMEETASAGTTSTEPPAASSEEDALEAEEPVNQMEETASAGTTSTEPPAASSEGSEPKSFTINRLLKVTKPLVKGKDVKAVQKALVARGFNCGTNGTTGVYGAQTAYAVRQFQAMNRLIVSGQVEKFTATALGCSWKD